MPVKTKQRRTFTLSTNVMEWIDLKARENKISRSKLINQLLDRYYQEEKRKEMEKGYKALRDILEKTAQASLSLQKQAIPDY